MRRIAYWMAKKGFTLRSGGAEGADTAFADGWGDAWSETAGMGGSIYKAEIYLPWEGFNDQYSSMEGRLILNIPEAQTIASEIHPAWDRLTTGAKALHTRNIYQVLGQDLNIPSTGVIFYAEPNGNSVKGGTRTAVELAKKHDIPVYNLYNERMVYKWENWIAKEVI